MKIDTRSASDNDELGAEYTLVNSLRKQLAEAKATLEHQKELIRIRDRDAYSSYTKEIIEAKEAIAVLNDVLEDIDYNIECENHCQCCLNNITFKKYISEALSSPLVQKFINKEKEQ